VNAITTPCPAKNPLCAPSTRASLFEFKSTHTEIRPVFVVGLVGRFEACVRITSRSVVPLRELVFGSALCWVHGVMCQLEWCQLPSNYKGRAAAPISRARRLHPSQYGKSAHHTGWAPPLQHACTRAPAQHATIHPASRKSGISPWHISARYGNSKNRNEPAQVATNASPGCHQRTCVLLCFIKPILGDHYGPGASSCQRTLENLGWPSGPTILLPTYLCYWKIV